MEDVAQDLVEKGQVPGVPGNPEKDLEKDPEEDPDEEPAAPTESVGSASS